MLNNQLFKLKKSIVPFKTAIITVFISVAASVAISAMSDTGKVLIDNEMTSMGLNGMAAVAYNKSGENITDNNFYYAVNSLNEIKNSTVVITETATATFENQNKYNVLCWGISEDAGKVVSLEITEGRMIDSTDIQRGSFVCLIDENIALNAYKRNNLCGKSVYITVNGNNYEFKIIGTIKKSSTVLNSMTGGIIPDFVYVPYTTMKNISVKSAFDQIIFTVSDSENFKDIFTSKICEYNPALTKSSVVLTDLSQQKEQISNIADIAFLSLFAVSCISVLVCSMAVGASVNTAVISKQKDIGIKISMGASRRNVICEFMISALTACIIGVFTALTGVMLVIYLMENITDLNISINYSLILFSISATIVLTAVFSFIPSCNAANLPPIKALNRE